MKIRKFIAALVLILVPAITFAQGLPIKDGDSSTLADVDANKNLKVTEGESTEATYIAAATSAFTASDSILNIEAEASRGFRIARVCIQPGNATAAVSTLWQLIRTTTASSGGTSITAEVTSGNNALAKMDPGSANWSGAVRTGGTEGSSGAIIDSGNLWVGVAATGTGPSQADCRDYGGNGLRMPTVAAGTTNGVKLMFTGTAGGTGQSATIYFIAD